MVDCINFIQCHRVLLKGVFNKYRIHDEVKTMVADLQLDDKANIQANHLSGGMKRKLRYEIKVNQCVLAVLQYL